jgi:Flp pilus assembly protein TadG
MNTRQPKPRSKESGITLLLGTVSLLFIVPMIGLAVDVGFLYAVKSKLQAAVDGSALAAARALSIGQSLGSQTTAAQNNAVNWFYANFPNNYFGTQGTVMSSANVNVFAAPNNPQLFNVTVTATTQVDTFFMKWLGFGATTVGSTGNASRRTVVAMLVLDRSGSMGPSCTDLKNAAKLFVGQFAAQRDYIGLVSFSDGFMVQSSPTQNFQTVLGYTNASGTGNGQIDQITCGGNTGSAQAISVGHNELIKTNLPGALNALLFETDGLPNTLTMNWWDSTNQVVGLASRGTVANPKGCKDNSNLTVVQGGFNNNAAIRQWTPGYDTLTSAFTVGYPKIPAGIVGSLLSDDPGGANNFNAMADPFQTMTNVTNGTTTILGTTTGCTSFTSSGSIADLKWVPTTDVWGNQLNPANAFKSPVTASGNYIQANSWTTFHNGALNAADNAAYRARTNLGHAATVGLGPVSMFVIGLGGNGAVDFTLLQRMANDPNGDLYNDPPQNHYYQPCASQPGCVYDSTQPQGVFIYSADKTKLTQSFQVIASQILRLSK